MHLQSALRAFNDLYAVSAPLSTSVQLFAKELGPKLVPCEEREWLRHYRWITARVAQRSLTNWERYLFQFGDAIIGFYPRVGNDLNTAEVYRVLNEAIAGSYNTPSQAPELHSVESKDVRNHYDQVILADRIINLADPEDCAKRSAALASLLGEVIIRHRMHHGAVYTSQLRTNTFKRLPSHQDILSMNALGIAIVGLLPSSARNVIPIR